MALLEYVRAGMVMGIMNGWHEQSMALAYAHVS